MLLPAFLPRALITSKRAQCVHLFITYIVFLSSPRILVEFQLQRNSKLSSYSDQLRTQQHTALKLKDVFFFFLFCSSFLFLKQRSPFLKCSFVSDGFIYVMLGFGHGTCSVHLGLWFPFQEAITNLTCGWFLFTDEFGCCQACPEMSDHFLTYTPDRVGCLILALFSCFRGWKPFKSNSRCFKATHWRKHHICWSPVLMNGLPTRIRPLHTSGLSCPCYTTNTFQKPVPPWPSHIGRHS